MTFGSVVHVQLPPQPELSSVTAVVGAVELEVFVAEEVAEDVEEVVEVEGAEASEVEVAEEVEEEVEVVEVVEAVAE